MIQQSHEREPVEILCEEFLQRWRNGESPTIEEYVRQHEELREDIVDLFPAMLALEGVKEDKSFGSTSRPIRLEVERLEQLGDYRIIREIGRGGMAIVYEAEQQSLQRRVAVKVFPQQAFDDSKQLKRFQREAQTAGCLHHNNIVPVFGTGEQDGLHYFVMQLLDGVPLDIVIEELRHLAAIQNRDTDPLMQIISHRPPATDAAAALRQSASTIADAPPTAKIYAQSAEHAPASNSSPRRAEFVHSRDFFRKARGRYAKMNACDASHWQRIADLGRQIADGLDYAHRHGILHRDIKPSNVVIDSELRVWITDFGLATAECHDRLSRSGDVAGTLRYMAPERLKGESDKRSDVYSLGLTMYELITLRNAYDGRGRGELTRQVVGAVVTPPRVIRPEIPRDLETIVLKAIAPEPDGRYQSAAELASDLRCFCEDRPIAARRVGRTERLARWSRRNPLLATLSGALLLSVTISLIAITANWQRALTEKLRAQNESTRAEYNLTLALASMDRLLEKFEADWMAHPIAPDTDELFQDSSLRFVVSDHSAAVLEEALLFYEQFARQNSENPKLQRDTAKAYARSGKIHERLGQLEEAEAAYKQNVELMVAQLDSSPVDSESAVQIARAHYRLANVLLARYRHHAALTELTSAKTILTDQLARDETSQALRFELALTCSSIGRTLWFLRDMPLSSERHRSAIRLLEQLVEESPQHSMYRLELARTYRAYYQLASIGRERKYFVEMRDAAEIILRDLVTDYPGVPDYQCELSEMLTSAASFRGATLERRLESLTHAIELAESLVVNFSSIPRYRAALAEALSKKAELLEATSLLEASKLHDRAVRYYLALCSQYPTVPHYFFFSGRVLVTQGKCLQELGDYEAARESYLAAIDQQRLYLEHNEDSVYGSKWLYDYLQQLAKLERFEGNHAYAWQLRIQALKAARSPK